MPLQLREEIRVPTPEEIDSTYVERDNQWEGQSDRRIWEWENGKDR